MTGSADLLRPSLYAQHRKAGATLGDEGGWEMPLSYGNTIREYRLARTQAGIIDISHMGRFSIRGDGALNLLEKLLTHDVAHQEDNTAHYTLLCNGRGGIIDHALCLRLEDRWLLTTSPLGRHRVAAHLKEHSHGLDVQIEDQTATTSHLYLTGPAAASRLDAVLDEKVSQLKLASARSGTMMMAPYVMVRSAAAGQWALEVILPNMAAGLAWDYITAKAGDYRFDPVGLAVWDLMRIEAGTVRFGHEINETVDPIMAGLDHWVHLEREFLGAPAIRGILQKGPSRRLAGLVLSAPSQEQPPPIPRQGTSVHLMDRTEIGTVTSGSFSPHLEKTIAMAYVKPEHSKPGTKLCVLAEAQPWEALVVALPFYRADSRI